MVSWLWSIGWAKINSWSKVNGCKKMMKWISLTKNACWKCNHEPIWTNLMNQWSLEQWRSMKINGINGWGDLDQVRPMTMCHGMWMHACLEPIKTSHVLGFSSQNSYPRIQSKASNREVIKISTTPISWTTTRVSNPPKSEPYSLPTSRSMIRVST